MYVFPPTKSNVIEEEAIRLTVYPERFKGCRACESACSYHHVCARIPERRHELDLSAINAEEFVMVDLQTYVVERRSKKGSSTIG